MPLRMLNIKPGFNKQFTASGAEGQWIDGITSDLDMDYLRK
jgi:hypothetical protein